jgi:hypothetical protein
MNPEILELIERNKRSLEEIKQLDKQIRSLKIFFTVEVVIIIAIVLLIIYT